MGIASISDELVCVFLVRGASNMHRPHAARSALYSIAEGVRALAFQLAAAAICFLLSSAAIAVELGFTSVIARCEIWPALQLSESLGKTFEQDLPCDLSTTRPGGRQYSAVGRANAGFGPAFPIVGNANVEADAYAPNEAGAAKVSVIALVEYYFEIEALKVVPGEPPLVLPIFFTARGDGSVNAAEGGAVSWATAEGSASLRGPNISGGVATLSLSNESALSFDETLRIDASPGEMYSVSLIAGCSVSAGTSASCQAAVDPVLAFDQATFDSRLGSSTFALEQYYRFVLGDNIPLQPPPTVPEPGTLALLGLSLAGLAASRRRKQ
jgi:hypothetical protein